MVQLFFLYMRLFSRHGWGLGKGASIVFHAIRSTSVDRRCVF